MNRSLARPIVTGEPLDLRRAFIRRTDERTILPDDLTSG
jgi:hypothetical protein